MIIGIDASRANHEKKGGVEWYAFFIIQELKKIIPADWKVVLYTDKPLAGELADVPENWTQKVLTWPPRRFWTQIRLSIEMILHPVDILFIPAHVPPLIHPKNTVMTVHDVAAIHFPETYNWFERWYSVASAKFAVQKLARVIVPSAAVKSDLVSLFKINDHSKIKVVPLGFNPEFSQRLTEEKLKEVIKKYNLPANYILSVGRLEEKKNTARLIAAFDKATAKGLGTDLVLVGKPGHGYAKIKQALDSSPNKNKIIILPWVEEADLVAMMQAAQMFVFPSLYEGFGLPILQAFAARVPVITSTAGSLPEVAGDAVLLVDPLDVEQLVDAMLKLSDNRAERERLIARGTERVKQFSWQKTGRETWEVLNSLCQ